MEIRENENLDRQNKAELYFVIFLFVFGLSVLFIIYSSIPNLTIMANLTIRTFPLVATILLLISLTIYLVILARKISLIKIKEKPDKIGIKKEFDEVNVNKKIFIFFSLIVIYFLSLNFTDYRISSSVFCVILSVFLGCRKWYLLLFLFLFPLFVYYIFHELLLVPLP